MAKFQGEGMNGNEARDKCRETYKELNDKQRLKWIYKSLQLEKQYNVIFKFIQSFISLEILGTISLYLIHRFIHKIQWLVFILDEVLLLLKG